MSVEETEISVVTKSKSKIQEYMKDLSHSGVTGEVMVVAKVLGMFARLDPMNLHLTEPIVTLKILRHEDID